jgi:predicted double-glycine peptidase
MRTDQAKTTQGKNVVVSDELRRRMIKTRNPEVETWKENISWKPVQKVKPTFDILIEKYVMRQQQ